MTLPDGRVLPFAMRERRGGLVERNFIHEGVRYRSGWIVLEDNRVRGRTMVLGGADSTARRPRAMSFPRISTRFAHRAAGSSRQSGIWELRLNRGRGSSAAYNRLTQVIGFLDETIFELEG